MRDASPTPRMRSIQALFAFCCVIALAYWIIVRHGGWIWFAPLAGSCIIAFVQPESLMAKKKNMIGGHLCAFAVAALMRSLMLDEGVAIVTATCITFGLMLALDCVHSPAGATPACVYLSTAPLPETAAVLCIGLGLTVLGQSLMRRLTKRRAPAMARM